MRWYLMLLLLLPSLAGCSQYRYDNQLFRTVYPVELCKELKDHPDALLLDVRSPGEFNDTSSLLNLNLGHLKGARNIEVWELEKRRDEIAAYKQRPVYVYCSHSQRSRRAARMLAEQGFTQIINLNGGLTDLYQVRSAQPCLQDLLTSGNSYSIISPKDLAQKLLKNEVVVLDVRPDSLWNHTAGNAKEKATGYLKGSRHVVPDSLVMVVQRIGTTKPIVLVDLTGVQAARAATQLASKGYTNLSVLLEGLDRWNLADKTGWGILKDLYQPAVKYTIISSPEAGQLLKKESDLLILDLRPAREFSNTSASPDRNIGHIKYARSFPWPFSEDRSKDLKDWKERPILLYAYSGSPEVHEAAAMLISNGFRKVYVLAGGLFNLRWTLANIKGTEDFANYIEAIPEENR